ncbi:Ribonuclease P protein subunit P38-related isoform 2 [Hibiscus syriacus]|uniref:Ribonuclease P protein subunit P38-related isoform 2 n=1 Tax=Hibiscus syriacus TaxID=106335 RepID=A0A6A3BW97_HIBSY|nr:neurofilament medium polypeptide-like [Hibiscus syriacus]XP_039065262.1 neurofilament medium polypeptide-like [Hibiscus syriacus]KAE8719708.1 Ribonuclease P protein subunit P38-related isoform 2 [Hibiscus syriacus]
MDEKRISGSYLIISEDKSDSLYPMYFGVSCAVFALRFLIGSEEGDEKWCEFRDKMLQGSAHLLGLLLWRIQREEEADVAKAQLLQKLQIAEKEIEELKQMRHEDAKANEKVVSIFSSQEQGWLIERKKLRLQIGALINDLRVLGEKKNEEIAGLNDKLNETEVAVESKSRMIGEIEMNVKELEEKAIKFESVAQELRESSKREAQEHSTELWKHKTAFIEIVSNQRQLEAEMGRAFRQVEDTKMELDAVVEQKEESVMLAQKLSMEITKMRKDLEQKDKILSAMLRKSKLDTAEKQLLLKEVKVSKAKKKQAELETERWKAVSETRHDRHSLKGMFHNQAQASSKLDVPELKIDSEVFYPLTDCQSPQGTEDFVVTADFKRLECWVQAEAEKYANVIEKRHHLELDAFAEQMRLKDEKLEGFRWRMLSMELESERLQSHVEALNQDVSQLRQDNMKLEALLLEREEELDSLKDQFASQLKPPSCQKGDMLNLSLHDLALTHDSFWPTVKIIKKKPTEEQQESKRTSLHKEEVIPSCNESKNIRLIVQSPEKKFEEEREPQEETNGSLVVESGDKSVSVSHSEGDKTKNNPWRMDLRALGVSYKIKRLKQQLLMLERLNGKKETIEGMEGDDKGMKAFLMLISLLNKQVSRYQSLQGKTDDLCKRMHENDPDSSQGDCSSAKSKGETRTLEHFLEETFHLQRYMVATGQKLMEIQTKIGSGFTGVELEQTASFDMKRFSDNMKSLFQEVQRGLEVRIARIIGDLEGTLACEGMIHFRRL